MARTPAWRRYARFFGVDVRRDVDEELRFHLDEKTRALIAEGLPPPEARAEALRQFGAVSDVRALCETWGTADARRAERRLLPDRLGPGPALRPAHAASHAARLLRRHHLDRARRRRQHRDLHAARSGAAAAAAGPGTGTRGPCPDRGLLLRQHQRHRPRAVLPDVLRAARSPAGLRRDAGLLPGRRRRPRRAWRGERRDDTRGAGVGRLLLDAAGTGCARPAPYAPRRHPGGDARRRHLASLLAAALRRRPGCPRAHAPRRHAADDGRRRRRPGLRRDEPDLGDRAVRAAGAGRTDAVRRVAARASGPTLAQGLRAPQAGSDGNGGGGQPGAVLPHLARTRPRRRPVRAGRRGGRNSAISRRTACRSCLAAVA